MVEEPSTLREAKPPDLRTAACIIARDSWRKKVSAQKLDGAALVGTDDGRTLQENRWKSELNLQEATLCDNSYSY